MKPHPHISQAQVKFYKKLLQKKYRQSERRFIVEGVHLVEEVLRSDWEVEIVLISDDFREAEGITGIEHQAAQRGVSIVGASELDIDNLSDTVTAQGIVAIAGMKVYDGEFLWKSQSKQSIVVALNDVSDPGNAGTIIRTCDWFGVDAVVLDGNTVELYNPKVIRSTMGSIFHLPVITGVPLAEVLQLAKAKGYAVYATTLSEGKPLSSEMFAEKSLIVLGNEARGVSTQVQQAADALVTIPKFGKADSLNVATSCAVVLASLRLQKQQE